MATGVTRTSTLVRWARRRRGRPLTFGAAALVVTATATAAVLAVPVVAVVVQASSVGWKGAVRILQRPIVPMLLWNTLQLTVLVSVGCAVVGVGVAWLVERTNLPGRRALSVLLVLPLAVPEFVASFGWVSLFPSLQGLRGATLVMTLSLYPWVYLPVRSSLRLADPIAEEVARSLGLKRWQCFTRVTLPSVRLATLGGVLIVALYLLAEYGAFALLRFRTLATAIYTEYSLGFSATSASVFTLVLCTLAVLLLAGEYRLRGRAGIVRGGGQIGRTVTPLRLGRTTPLALAMVLGVIAFALGIPISSVLYWMIKSPSTTLPSASVFTATLESLWLGGISAVVATVLAVPVALLTVRHPGPFSRVVERSSYLVRSVPGIAIGLTFVTVTIRNFPGLYQTRVLLIAAYVVLGFPLALVAARAAVARVPPIIEDAARSLGAPPRRVLRRVTIPLVLPGLGAAAVLVWLTASTELTATLLLRPTGTETLATRFWSYASGLAYGAAAPYAGIMIVLSAVPTMLLFHFGGQRRPERR